jgi:hypothetical protein
MNAMNDGVRFMLELATLVTVAWLCWRQPHRIHAKVLLAVTAPVVIGTVWAIWISANSPSKVDDPLRLLLEVAVFASGVVALLALKHTRWALLMGSVAVLHLMATFPLNQRY